MILNLTQHRPTAEQVAAGVGEPLPGSAEETLPDGTVCKTQHFRHLGFCPGVMR
jgi:hypothetical protein